MNEILIKLNGKLISICDVGNMTYMTKQSIGFATHCLSLVAGIEQKFMIMFKQAVMWKHGVQMHFVKVFVGPSGWGVTVHKLYALYACMGSCSTCCDMCVPNSELLLRDQGK